MGAAEMEVPAAVEALRQAKMTADRDGSTTRCAPELCYGHSGGTLETKDDFIGANTSGLASRKRLSLEDQTITLSGDVALVRHIKSARRRIAERWIRSATASCWSGSAWAACGNFLAVRRTNSDSAAMVVPALELFRNFFQGLGSGLVRARKGDPHV